MVCQRQAIARGVISSRRVCGKKSLVIEKTPHDVIDRSLCSRGSLQVKQDDEEFEVRRSEVPVVSAPAPLAPPVVVAPAPAPHMTCCCDCQLLLCFGGGT